jgi:hypothetical protein
MTHAQHLLAANVHVLMGIWMKIEIICPRCLKHHINKHKTEHSNPLAILPLASGTLLKERLLGHVSHVCPMFF